MSTVTLHAHVQRRRFANHTWAALFAWLPAWSRLATSPTAAPAPGGRAEVAAREAQLVREMAQTYAKTDPGFASDLFAAAARHEGEPAA